MRRPNLAAPSYIRDGRTLKDQGLPNRKFNRGCIAIFHSLADLVVITSFLHKIVRIVRYGMDVDGNGTRR